MIAFIDTISNSIRHPAELIKSLAIPPASKIRIIIPIIENNVDITSIIIARIYKFYIYNIVKS